VNDPQFASGSAAASSSNVFKLTVYLVAVLAVSGGVSGGLYLLLVAWGVDSLDFGKVSFRTLEFVAIAGSIPLLAAYGHRGWAAWGFDRSPLFFNHVLRGLLLGVVSLSIISAVLLVFDLRVIRPDLITDPGHWLEVVTRSALAALLIAVIEEAWFRGALQNIVTSAWSVPGAVFSVAVFYALMHFLRPEGILDGQSVQLWSGFEAIVTGFGNFSLAGMLDTVVALIIIGVLLGILRARHGNIAMCIGVHAGWVFVIKVYKKFTYINPQAELNMLVGQYDGVLGWLAAGLLLVLTVLVWRYGWPHGRRSV